MNPINPIDSTNPMNPTNPTKLALVGTGNWGKNLVRNFCELLGAQNVTVCDTDEKTLETIGTKHPGVKTTADFERLVSDEAIQALVIATPAITHFQLAKRALQKGKHVLVEKPIAMEISQAIELINLAEKQSRVLMVDHLLEYHPAVEQMRQRIDSGELGQIYYAYGQRVNLGVVRTEENALWSLGPHDISVLLYLLGQEPKRVSAHGGIYLQKEKHIEDVVFLDLEFTDNLRAHSHLSWLDPHKIRKMTIVGDRAMMVFDDMESRNKLQIFDKGAQLTNQGGFHVRFGDVYMPNVELAEPLRKMCTHFLDCVAAGKQPRSNGYDGLRVLKVLDAAQRSLESGGKPMIIMNTHETG
jgi:predicted dehydrogenase